MRRQLLFLALGIAPLHAAPMLIAPHIEGENFCPAADADPKVLDDEQSWTLCAARGQNHAAALSAFLDGIGPKTSPSGQYALGYTLTLPVLGVYTRGPQGWRIDPARIRTYISLLSDVDRPAVLYLSANHFTDAAIELSNELAQDKRNLMWTRSGPIKPGGYFSVGTIAWTLADYDAPITQLRQHAFSAILGAVCALPPAARARIAGVNVLGEVHQLFAGFPDKMGYGEAMEISDYSPAAVAGFRRFLAARYSSIAAFNAETGFDFANFAAIEPPAHNLAHEILHGFAQQWDGNATGTLAFQGWAYTDDHLPLTVSLWLDGRKIAEAPVHYNRLDVTDAVPGLPTPNLGWQIKLEYSALPFGIHVADLLIAAPGHKPVRFAQRHIVVDDRHQDTPPPNTYPGIAAPGTDSWPGLHADMDGPADWTALFYNPLARLWQAWRAQQVRDYITHFATLVDTSCLGPGLAFSHEINPRLNSSWNADLVAVDAAEAPSPAYHPGTTLYGGAAFGDAFFDMARSLGWHDYAVTELHPVFNLDQAQMEQMLNRHRLAGARYVQPYYMTIKPPRLRRDTNTLTHRMIRPDNPVQGSGTFDAAIRDLMRHH